jgi:hypothetical protein
VPRRPLELKACISDPITDGLVILNAAGAPQLVKASWNGERGCGAEIAPKNLAVIPDV